MADLRKVTAEEFSMDRKKDGRGNLSVAARRATTEKALLPDFFETRKDLSGFLAVPPEMTILLHHLRRT